MIRVVKRGNEVFIDSRVAVSYNIDTDVYTISENAICGRGRWSLEALNYIRKLLGLSEEQLYIKGFDVVLSDDVSDKIRLW